MTHEERLALAIKFNKERQANKVAGQIATRHLIKAEELAPEEVAQLVGIYPEWSVGVNYGVGDLVSYTGTLYQVIQAHTSQADWTPDTVQALFKSYSPEGVIPEWKQPTGSHDAYNKGDRVTFKGLVYESTINGNTWSPEAYPQGWQQINQ